MTPLNDLINSNTKIVIPIGFSVLEGYCSILIITHLKR